MTTAAESELALSVRARILPMIEGSDQFFQTLEQIPNRVTAPMQQLTQEPGFVEGLTPGQISKVQNFAGGEDEMVMQDYQAKIKKLRDEISITMKASEESGHKITTYDLFGMHKKMLTEQAALEDFRGKQMSAIDEMDIPKEKKEFMKEALVSGIKDASAGLDELNPKLKEMVGQMKEGGEAGKSIYSMLQQGGYLTLMGQATQTAMNWTLSEAKISAKELTSFNLTSPMGSYASTEEAKVFKETTERTRESELIGKIVGAVAAIGLVTATGGAGAVPIAAMAAGGSMFGGMIGGQFAEIENTESRAKLEADIKYRSEAYSEASRLVQSSMAYDISKFKAGQRFGKEGIGGSVLGYSPDETLELQKSFAEQYGKMDEDLFKEQTLFARKSGLDPRQMYQFGEMERLTGNKLSYGEFSEVEKKSQQLFGTEVDKERVVDILKDIREVAMKQLKAGIDTHDAIRFAVDLPRMLMGNASPYGRAGDLGAETSSAFERFGNPQNLAQESVLFRAWGENGMFGPDGYLSRRREGIMNPRNFRSAIEEYRREGGYTDKGAQAIMEGIDPGRTMAKPIYDKFIGLFGEKGEAQYDEYKLDKNGKRIPIKGEKDEKGEQKYEMESKTVKLEEFYKMVENEGKGIGEGGKEFLDTMKKANSFRSAEEAQQTEIRNKNLEAAKAFEKTIFDGQKEQASFWVNMGKSTEVQKDMVETIRKGIDAQYAWMITSGIENNPEKISDFIKKLKKDAFEDAGVDPTKLSEAQQQKILEKAGVYSTMEKIKKAGSMPGGFEAKDIVPEGESESDRLTREEVKRWKKSGKPDRSSLFEEDMKIPEAYRNEPQRQTSDVKELTAKLDGMETMNRQMEALINGMYHLGDKLELASMRQTNTKVEVKSADSNVYGYQTDFIEENRT